MLPPVCYIITLVIVWYGKHTAATIFSLEGTRVLLPEHE